MESKDLNQPLLNADGTEDESEGYAEHPVYPQPTLKSNSIQFSSGFQSDSGFDIRRRITETPPPLDDGSDEAVAPIKVMRRGILNLPPKARAEKRAQKRARKLKLLQNEQHKTVQSICMGEAFEEVEVIRILRSFHLKPRVYTDAIHVEIGGGDVFVLLYGVVIFWGMEEEAVEEFSRILKEVVDTPLSDPEEDDFEFMFGDVSNISRDRIVLATTEVQEKMAVSFALAQSVKLSAYEEKVQGQIEDFRSLPEELAEHGGISMSSTDVSKNIGRLFMAKNDVNLNSDILDTPEYFWEDDLHLALFMRISNYLEIEKRTRLLNRRLDILGDLLEMLNHESEHRHASKLEWIIIWLIVIEIAIELIWMMLLKDTFHVVHD